MNINRLDLGDFGALKYGGLIAGSGIFAICAPFVDEEISITSFQGLAMIIGGPILIVLGLIVCYRILYPRASSLAPKVPSNEIDS